MKVSISESRFIKVMFTYLALSFDGFNECYYDWSDFDCGLGVCCDPYSVGFVLPDGEYDDYLFKIVNGEYYDENGNYPEELKGDLPEPCHSSPNIGDEDFDTLILSDDMYERIGNMFGNVDVWGGPLMNIINKTFNSNVTHIHPTTFY